MEHESAPLVDDRSHLIKPKQTGHGASVPGTSKGGKKGKRKARTPEQEAQLKTKRLKALERARAVRKANLENKLKKTAEEEKREVNQSKVTAKKAVIEGKTNQEEKVVIVEPVNHVMVDEVNKQDLVADERIEAMDRVESEGGAPEESAELGSQVDPDTDVHQSSDRSVKGRSNKEKFVIKSFPATRTQLRPTDTTLLYKGLKESDIIATLTEPTTTSNRYKQLPDVSSPFQYLPEEMERYMDMVSDRHPTSETIRQNVGLEMSKYDTKIAQPGLRAYVEAPGMTAPSVAPGPAIGQYTRDIMSGRPSYQRSTNYQTAYTAIPPDLFTY